MPALNQEWSFVSVGQKGKLKNANDRSTIRKVAMQSFRRKERADRAKLFAKERAIQTHIERISTVARLGSTSPGSPPREFGALQCIPQVPLYERESLSNTDIHIHVKLEPSTPISPGLVSPGLVSPGLVSPGLVSPGLGYWFNNVPANIPRSLGVPGTSVIGDSSLMNYLFDYFISCIVSIMLPIEGLVGQTAFRNFWIAGLSRDDLILRAAVAHSAVHIDALKGTNLAAVYNKHATRLINERMSQTDRLIDDGVIEAIGLLASNCTVTGNVVESEMHMNALQEIVKMNGGKAKLGTNNTVQLILSWSDITSARISRSKPRLPDLICDTDDLPLLKSEISPTAIRQDEIATLVQELRELAALKEAIDKRPAATIRDITSFDARRSALEERILCLQYDFSNTLEIKFGDQYLSACCIAASIYMCLCFRRFSPAFPILRTLKNDLMAAVDNLSILYGQLPALPDSETPYAEVLLWVLFVGGSLVLDDVDRTWFVDRIAQILPWTSAACWEDTEDCLKRMLWVDKLRSSICLSLWEEAQRKTGLEPGLGTGTVSEIEEDEFLAKLLN